jgi:putative Holliday junction resolvase
MLRNFLKDYLAREEVAEVIIGLPLGLDGQDTDATPAVRHFMRLFKKDHPQVPLFTVDEQYTSKMAFQTMIDSGLKKKDRRNKKLIDEIAATIMLQAYLESRV